MRLSGLYALSPTPLLGSPPYAIFSILQMFPFYERVLILGSGPPAERIAGVIEKSRRRCTILGFVDDRTSKLVAPVVPRHSLLGDLQDLDQIIDTTRADRIVVAVSGAMDRLPIRELVGSRLSGIRVEDWIEAYERSTGKLAIENLPTSSVVFCRSFDAHRHVVTFRRWLDFVFGAVGLLLTAPLMALAAIAIKLDSRGPVFFVHKRLGYKGRAFDLLKFRTMHPNNGEISEWVRDNDHRLTRIGGILRQYRLDELPQFLNILRGEMALVGPRPHPVTNVDLFTEKIPYYMIRDLVPPGITGWSQIRLGYANDLEEETEKMRYDLYYIKHQSLGFDLRILLETIQVVLFGRGSKTRLPDDEATGLPDYKTTFNPAGAVTGSGPSALSSQHSPGNGYPASTQAVLARPGNGRSKGHNWQPERSVAAKTKGNGNEPSDPEGEGAGCWSLNPRLSTVHR